MCENRYIIFNGKIAIQYSDLIINGILKERQLDNLIQRNIITRLLRASKGIKALIDFDNLPEDLKAKVIKIFGLPPLIKNITNNSDIRLLEYKDKLIKTQIQLIETQKDLIKNLNNTVDKLLKKSNNKTI